jgi:hypothetical protein
MAASLDDLARRFRRFGREQALPTSPLYSQLALGMADDPSILCLAQFASSSPVTNLMFAAVHHLLLSGVDHPLRAYYCTLTRAPEPAHEAFPAFRSFCQMYEADLIHILQTRRTQTNEVRRCLYLALGLDLVGRAEGRYSVIDVGASAGLHLLWPHYRYDYEGHVLGDARSSVRLTCRFVGDRRPLLPETWSTPTAQVGIDLHPLDPCRPEDVTWLRALVWPEHRERSELLESALGLARMRPPSVVPGDVFTELPDLLAELPPDEACCVCHNMTLNQFADADRVRFDGFLGELARGRVIYRLSGEWVGTEKPEFVLSRYENGSKTQRLLARVDDHGAWVEWCGP